MKMEVNIGMLVKLQIVLEYKEWRNFEKVIKKAIISAKNSINKEKDWLVEVNKPIKSGKGKQEFIKDYKLSRYICYLNEKNNEIIIYQTSD
jgi:DNA-damage-inducible protein D